MQRVLEGQVWSTPEPARAASLWPLVTISVTKLLPRESRERVKLLLQQRGGVAERLNAAVLKTVRGDESLVSSNLTPSARTEHE